MSEPNPPVGDEELVDLEWRVSSFSEPEVDADCIEVARLPDGRTALRNRRRPEEGAVIFTPAEMDAWIKGCKAGEFDDIR
jgi:hypothetical protein